MVGSLLSLPGPAVVRVKSVVGQDWLALMSCTHQDTLERLGALPPFPRPFSSLGTLPGVLECCLSAPPCRGCPDALGRGMTGGALVAQLDVWERVGGGRILRPEAVYPQKDLAQTSPLGSLSSVPSQTVGWLPAIELVPFMAPSPHPGE